jgi:hypothetical protein
MVALVMVVLGLVVLGMVQVPFYTVKKFNSFFFLGSIAVSEAICITQRKDVGFVLKRHITVWMKTSLAVHITMFQLHNKNRRKPKLFLKTLPKVYQSKNCLFTSCTI